MLTLELVSTKDGRQIPYRLYERILILYDNTHKNKIRISGKESEPNAPKLPSKGYTTDFKNYISNTTRFTTCIQKL